MLGLFNKAGATGYVFLVSNGKVRDRGLAYSGIIGPTTTVAVVPAIEQIINFSVSARTKDKQTASVTGDVKVTLNPLVAVKEFDFTVEPKSGSYQSRWEQDLQAAVMERVLRPVRAVLKNLDVDGALVSEAEIETAIMAELTATDSALVNRGVTIESCSLTDIAIEDEEVAESIGAVEREQMLTEADAARHTRQMKTSANARAVKTYDAQTNLKLEEERSSLLTKQGENKKKEAGDDAEATKLRLEPFTEVEAGQAFVASLMEMARSGRIGSINVGPELLAALKQA